MSPAPGYRPYVRSLAGRRIRRLDWHITLAWLAGIAGSLGLWWGVWHLAIQELLR